MVLLALGLSAYHASAAASEPTLEAGVRVDEVTSLSTDSGEAVRELSEVRGSQRTEAAPGNAGTPSEANPHPSPAERRSAIFPTFRSADGEFSFRLRGRILLDVTASRGSRFDGRNITNSAKRSLRLGFEGAAGDHLLYAFETEFAGEGVDVGTALLGWRGKSGELDYELRVGNLFNDRGVEGSTRSDATPFEERNVVGTAIAPQRGFFGAGASARLFGPRWHVSLALTGDAVGSEQPRSDGLTLMARAHWNPLSRADRLVHIGIWAFDETLGPSAGDIARRTVIGGRFNPDLRVPTGPIIDATGDRGFGVELGGYTGPFWTMVEAGRREVRLHARSDVSLSAWSVSAGWFLTGETPPLSGRTGTFGQPRVRRPLVEGGAGAVELTARYETLDYSALPAGGRGKAATVGLNWYLADYSRVMVNVIRWSTWSREGPFAGDDGGTTIALRFGVTF